MVLMKKAKAMMDNLLLFDADVIIDLHELGFWKGVFSNYSLYMASSVIDEVDYYINEDNECVKIDLKTYVKEEKIKEVSALAVDTAPIIAELDGVNLSGRVRVYNDY